MGERNGSRLHFTLLGRRKGGHGGGQWLPLTPCLPVDALPLERYLPDIELPENIVAMAELDSVVDGADVLIICAPHQFVRGICKQLEASGKVGAGGRHCGRDRYVGCRQARMDMRNGS